MITVECLRVVKQREFEIKELAEPASADEAKDGGHADIHLPAVARVGDELRRGPGQGADQTVRAPDRGAFKLIPASKLHDVVMQPIGA